MRMELIGKSQTIQEQETCFLHLIEETQLDLIWHPDRREKCEITFTHGHREIEVYVYREDCPMSAFREYAMFLLFMPIAWQLIPRTGNRLRQGRSNTCANCRMKSGTVRWHLLTRA